MDLFHTLLLCWPVLVISVLTDIDRARYSEGERQFELMQKQSQMPKYGQCWKNAMIFIRNGCKRLSDETQTRLSLAYLNCFLELQGRPSYACSEEEEMRDCVAHMGEADRSSFTTFFTHTQNICYFLQAQVWHEHTEATISRLSDSSSLVAEQLENSHELQKDMLVSQSQSLDNQKQLMNQTVSLNHIINSSSKTVQVLFEDLKKSTQEQREVIGDLFDKLSKLQNTILGEVSGFYSLFYYVLSIIVCYLLTSTPRTAGARLWLFLVMTISVVLEQTLVPWLSQILDALGSQPDGNEQIYWLQKLCRRLFIIVALVVLAVSAFMFKDMNTINNQLLMEIKKQNSDIRRSLTGQMLAIQSHAGEQSASVCSDSDYTSGESDDADSDVDSDKTYILPENKEESDAESFMTLPEGSEDTADQTSLLCELYDLRKATPLREMTSKVDAWLERSHLSGSNIDAPASPPAYQVSTYNLRPRGVNASPNISPASRVESVKSFSRTVRQMQEITEKNSRLLRAYQQSADHAATSQDNTSLQASVVSPSEGKSREKVTPRHTAHLRDADRSSIVTRSSRGSVRERL